MLLRINDIEKDYPQDITIRQLLRELKIKGPVAVELNRKVCPRSHFDNTVLHEGDVLEIVTIVGGG